MTEKEKLIQMLLENEDIKRYKRIEKHINANKELKAKMNELKSIQKQLVNAKQIQKTEAIKTFQERYDQCLEAIESYPLMSDYLALQSDINEVIQAVLGIIEDGIEKDFE
ncbi:MAG: YlbF family regulator [Acholeplasmataceae bacterium]|nr:YlbF family regulator [Acholeplasmataceae bacterium]